MLGHVRRRHSNELTFDQPSGSTWRRVQLCIAADAGVQHSAMRCGLPGVSLESHLVTLHGIVRWRCVDQLTLGDGGSRQWRRGLSRADADAGVQHTAMRCGLPSVCVESGLVTLHGIVRWRHVHIDADHYSAARSWRRGLSRADADAGMQHTRLPGGLHRVRLGSLVSVLCHVRWRCPIPNPHGGGARSERWQGLPRIGAKARLQHDPVSSQLRRE